MAFVIADRVRETTTSTGTGSVTLAGAYTSFQTFSAAIGNGNNTYYTIASASSGEWEVGIGTYSSGGNLLSRDTVLASSAAGAKVTFSTGTKDVFVTQPAERSLLLQSGGTGLLAGAAAFTANGLLYANATTTVATSSALTFDGTNFKTTGSVLAGGAVPSSGAGVTLAYNGSTTGYIYSYDWGASAYKTLNIAGGTVDLSAANNTQITFGVNGSEQMRLTSTGLGVGITSPYTKFDVTSGSLAAPTLGSPTAYAAAFRNGVGGGGYGLGVSVQSSGNAWLQAQRFDGTATAYDMVLQPLGGNLGIGTSSPATKLDVNSSAAAVMRLTRNGGTAANTALQYFNGTNSWYAGMSASGLYSIGYNDAALDSGQLRLDSSGNLGLGVTPSSMNTITAMQLGYSGIIAGQQGTAEVFYLGSNWYYNSGFKYKNNGYASRYNTDSGSHSWYTAASGAANAAITFIQAMTLDASGNLLVGITSATAAERLNVTGAQNSLPIARINNTNNTAYSTSSYTALSLLYLNNPSTTAGTASGIAFGTLGSGSGSVASIGAVATNNSGYGSALVFQTRDTGGNDAERARIDSSGNLGIGTSSPQSRLEIAQSADNTDGPKLRIANNGNTLSNGQLIGGIDFFNGDDSGEGVGAYIYSYTTDSIGRTVGQDLRFATGGTTERMRLDSSGNLGLGVTPSAWTVGKVLQIGGVNGAFYFGDGNQAIMGSNAFYGGSWKYGGAAQATRYEQGSGTHAWYNAPSGTAGNAITFTQAMTLFASGNLTIGGTNDSARLRVEGTTNLTTGLQLFRSGNSCSALWAEASALRFGVDGSTGFTERMALDASGNLALTKIAFNSDSPFYTGANISSGSTALGIGSTGAAQVGFFTNNTERARIDSSGNLGLGVTPSAWATVVPAIQLGSAGAFLAAQGSSTNVRMGVNAYYNGGYLYTINGAASMYQQAAGVHAWHTAASGAANTAITFIQAMTLDASGNLRIGLTSAAYNTERITVYKSGNVESAAFVNDAGANNYTVAVSNRATTGDNKFMVFATESSDTTRGTIAYNRGTGLVVYSTTSDYRAKDIIGPVENPGAVIDAVPVYIGKMKGATQERPMFIAHETPAYAHTGEKDAVDEEGNPIFQQMDASSLVPILWAELQSLRRRVAQLEGK